MSLGGLYIVCRWLHFSALMSLGAAGVFTVLLAPLRYRFKLSGRLMPLPLLTLACWLTLVSALLLLAAQTGLMGDGWADTLNVETWRAVLQTQFGRVWQWQLLLATAACLALRLRGVWRQQVILACALAQLCGMAFVGHAAMLDGGWGLLQRTNHIVHLLSAAFWAGGLLPVVILTRAAYQNSRAQDAITTLMRFSRYGHLAVALVLISGVVNALLLLGWPPQSFRLYSQLLLLKTVLVLLMVAIALFNRYWLVPHFQKSGARAQRYFVITTLGETALAALVLLTVSIFATLEPA